MEETRLEKDLSPRGELIPSNAQSELLGSTSPTGSSRTI